MELSVRIALCVHDENGISYVLVAKDSSYLRLLTRVHFKLENFNFLPGFPNTCVAPPWIPYMGQNLKVWKLLKNVGSFNLSFCGPPSDAIF